MDQITACHRAEGAAPSIYAATHPAPVPGATGKALSAAVTRFRPQASSKAKPRYPATHWDGTLRLMPGWQVAGDLPALTEPDR
ncbi:hypothetical protein [Caulobacter sp. S45]|uniref:hypothetical protein n=1 Tax=Caulobacter sp. S45 TaxID=1641861 RepID=UPI001575A8FF|nr:hypothetical protein [Caulobacter sp. S45]